MIEDLENPLPGYEFKTSPLKHQAVELAKSTENEMAGYFWVPGLGKSYLIINQASYLYEKGKIDTLVVVAPNGVHRNWVSDELPKHMPDRVMRQCKTVIYHSSKAKTKTATKAREALFDHKGLVILVVAYEACITDTFKAYMKRLFAKRKSVFMCLDESHRIKGRDAKVKMTLVAMGKYASYRRILTGTPVEQPIDVYSQLRFLDQDFWKKQGFPTSIEFDTFFCEYEEKSFMKRGAGGRVIIDPATGKPARNVFKAVTGYKNIDILQKMVAKICTRLTLEDAGIHLPPVSYTKRYYEMFPEQRRMYEQLREEFRTEFADGTEVSADAAITRLLRLQQIICGYASPGADEPVKLIDPKKNPRLDLCLEILEDLPHQALIWCRFRQDVFQLCDALGDQAAGYYGDVDNDTRALIKRRFQEGELKYLVLTDAGAEGHTLVGAKTAVFYSNHFKYIKREQMQARNHRIGQNDPVQVIDLVCEGTVDNDIIEALRNKKDVAGQLVGDIKKDWI